MRMKLEYWNKAVETQSRSDLEANQLHDLRSTVDQALKTDFYKKRLNDAGIHSGADIRSLDDLNRIPYTTKDDLRSAYPYGLLATDHDRLHSAL